MPETPIIRLPVQLLLRYAALSVLLCVFVLPTFAAVQESGTQNTSTLKTGVSVDQTSNLNTTIVKDIKDITDIARNIVLMLVGLVSLYFAWCGVRHYLNDVEMKRIGDALDLYNCFDNDTDCILAMTMLDYYGREQGFTFKYKLHASQESVDVKFTSDLFHDSMVKPYEQLDKEQRAIRFILDRWLGWLERVFYCVEKGYFHHEELVFYRYWLDLLVDDKFGFLRSYAVENTCGTFNPFLNKYKDTISPQITEWLRNIEKSKHHSQLTRRPGCYR